MEVKDILLSLTKDNIVHIMDRMYSPSYQYGKDDVIMFEGICHGSSSKKLYYYHNPRTKEEDDIGRNFYCYVCGQHGSIIDILQDLSGLDFKSALKIIEEETGECYSRRKKVRGLQFGSWENTDLSFLSIHTRKKQTPRQVETVYDSSVLNSFSTTYPLCWEQEGIDGYTADKFDIRYYDNGNQAIIPVRNIDAELIGIRVRNFEQRAVDGGFKYMPLTFKGVQYKFPTSNTLYGLYENQENIKATGKVFLFESEKAVMQVDSFYDGFGLGVAVYGSNFSTFHRTLLLQMGVREVTICFDKEYCEEWYNEEHNKTKNQILMFKYFKKLKKICKMLNSYFTVNIVIDFDNLLELKDAPTDKGKEVFQQLLKDKITIIDVDKDFKEYFRIEG